MCVWLGTITIKDHATGATLLTEKIPLTPGPVRRQRQILPLDIH